MAGAAEPDDAGVAELEPAPGKPAAAAGSGIDGGLGIASPHATTNASATARLVRRSERATVVFFMM